MSASGAIVTISAVPTAWRIENYTNGSANPVNLWYTGSSCTNGGLQLPSTATVQDANRLFSLLMAAKLASHTMFVYYDNTSSPAACNIISFGMDN
jgi:hypothetical protein